MFRALIRIARRGDQTGERYRGGNKYVSVNASYYRGAVGSTGVPTFRVARQVRTEDVKPGW